MTKQKQIETEKEYLILNKNDRATRHNTWIEVNDVECIIPMQEAYIQGTTNKVFISTVIFKDKSAWQVPIEEDYFNYIKNKYKEIIKNRSSQ